MDIPVASTNESAAPAAKARPSLGVGLGLLAGSVGVGLLLAVVAASLGLVMMELAQLAPKPPGAADAPTTEDPVQHAP